MYSLYIPLYLAGPIITFNDFTHQVIHSIINIEIRKEKKIKLLVIQKRTPLFYLIRWIISLLLMEFIIHFMHTNALSHLNLYKSFTPLQMALFGYLQLNHIWLKLLIIWRFFRLWAMMDGVLVIENMKRCMSNNYSVSEFWKGWHCSFNRWLVRLEMLKLISHNWVCALIIIGFLIKLIDLFYSTLLPFLRLSQDISISR